MVFGFGWRNQIKSTPVVWSFAVYDRLNVNMFIPKSLIQVAWQGNKQFVGQRLDHSDTKVLGMYFREFSLGAAMPVLKWSNWSMRAGLRLSYYQGLAGIDTPLSRLFSLTEENAEFIDLDYDLEYFHTGIDDFDLFRSRGNGFGANLGLSVRYKEKLNFDLGVTDLGSIKYKKDIKRVNSQGLFRFYGLGLEDLIDPTAFLDSIQEIFRPEIDSLGTSTFSLPVGTKLSFMTTYTFGRLSRLHGKNKLFFLYTQGFDEHPGVTVDPKFTLAFHKPIFRHFVGGLSVSLGGFNNYGVGGLIGINFANFRFSIQSDDFTGFFAPEKTTGAGAGFLLQLLL